LCLQVRDLQNSHLMPASLYKKSRTQGGRNPNLMQVTDPGSVQASRQLRNFVLCWDCEQLFSKSGENYAMTQVFDCSGNRFPLLNALRAATPSWTPAMTRCARDVSRICPQGSSLCV